MPDYPAPPWQTHGFGVSAAYLIRANDVDLPAELEPAATVVGRGPAMLTYIEYQAPSPLEYHELIWLPAYVRASGDAPGGKRPRGWYVARMYVDDEASLAAGRTEWALPKTLARFERTEDGVHVEADDGTRLTLAFRRTGPAVRGRGKMGTLQVRDGGLVQFQADFDARFAPASLRVTSFESEHPAWDAFHNARRLPVPAGMMDPFDSTMRAPVVLEPRSSDPA